MRHKEYDSKSGPNTSTFINSVVSYK